jgi:hypothetical protein
MGALGPFSDPTWSVGKPPSPAERFQRQRFAALAGPGGNGIGFTQTNGASKPSPATIVGSVWRLIASSGNPPGGQRVWLAIACFRE